MSGIHTARCIAAMQNAGAFRQRAADFFVDESVRVHAALGRSASTELAVAAFVDTADPQPAVVRSSLFDVRPESLDGWHRLRACFSWVRAAAVRTTIRCSLISSHRPMLLCSMGGGEEPTGVGSARRFRPILAEVGLA